MSSLHGQPKITFDSQENIFLLITLTRQDLNGSDFLPNRTYANIFNT